MKTTLIALAGALAACGVAAPAQAQDAPVNGVLTIFGEDPCPRDTICVRAPEEERFRIPKTIREQTQITPRNESWAVRQESVLQEGQFGTGSCSTVGAGGQTGCFVRDAARATAEARARQERANSLPLP